MVRNAVRTAAAIVLIGIGLTGLVVPIIPGIPLLLVAAAVLGPDHRLVRPLRGWLTRWRAQRKEKRHEMPSL